MKPIRDGYRRRDAPRENGEWWETASELLWRRCRGVCDRCGKNLDPDRYERHHRMKRRDGGDRLSNLLALCRTCHQWITEHPALARDSGFIVPALGEPRLDPAQVPVRIGPYGLLHRLDDEGRAIPIA